MENAALENKVAEHDGDIKVIKTTLLHGSEKFCEIEDTLKEILKELSSFRRTKYMVLGGILFGSFVATGVHYTFSLYHKIVTLIGG